MISNLKTILLFIILSAISFGNETDLDAINKLIDNYSKTEDEGKLLEQAKMMSKDRVWIGNNGAGRITDQSLNMIMQQSQVDAVMKSISGIKWFTDTRDRLIKFYGDGKVAVASFYWHRTFVLPPNTNSEKRNMMKKQPDPVAISLVLEKKKGVWKIVHTHTSLLVNKDAN
jgi:hypothetical protein|tara:strand:+ start:79 stop:591 length:513 start_codon:yes stop_codon:yes gene_type:complete